MSLAISMQSFEFDLLQAVLRSGDDG